jgi:hypothetical protein
VTPEEEAQFGRAENGFRDLYLVDILRANDCDVRMGTFILCAAFLDALSLTYSAKLKIPGGKRGKWTQFMKNYFGKPYERIWDSYDTYRNRLLHNYSAQGIVFIHGPENAALHLQLDTDGNVLLHRESFTRDVEQAFNAFVSDVRADPKLRGRALAHLECYPPMGLVGIVAAP